jgi:aryl-alcohol dehydrogenase-like predicted oxidoreductase
MKTGSAATVASILGPKLWGQLNEAIQGEGKPLPRRPLGKTGEKLSIIGLGGIVVMGGTQKDADARVGEAIDKGVNYFDVAPTYGRGEAEQKLGPALKQYRDKVFLACKTQKRDRAGARSELDASLKQLQTDHFDLYQMHAIRDVEKDIKRALAPGGAAEAFVEARKQGKVRFLGFSAHSAEAALVAIESGIFDTILYPVNFVCHQRGNFDQEVLKAAEAKSMGRLALKAMALTRWPKGSKRKDRKQPKCWYQPVDDPALVALALRWTLGQGVTAAIPPGDEKLFQLAINVASLEAELAPQEVVALHKVAEEHEPIFAWANA